MPAATTSEHAHHWMIGQPVDGAAQGVCIFCNVSREFSHTRAIPADWRAQIDRDVIWRTA